MALALLMPAVLLEEPARSNARLAWSVCAASGFLVVWGLILLAAARRSGRAFDASFQAIRAHWVQALVQGCIYAYWGTRSSGIYAEAPLILSQILFLYVFEALLAWSRGRPWRAGFGPLPVVFSTNLLLWFRHDWYVFQFAMVAIGALGKEFIRWNRDGKNTHVFNPSAFGQSVVALVLIATGTTAMLTLGEELAVAFETVPYMLFVLFGLGLFVQSLFGVTLMTLSATLALVLLNLVYTGVTGSYYFVTINIGATVFLGLHLLMTDPSTSPRSNAGRVIYGALYGIGYSLLFRLFNDVGVPVFWDKLLPVPVLNLSVKLIDGVMRTGLLGRINRAWETALPPRKLNLVHMAVWSALFGTLFFTGFIGRNHQGKEISFWRDAYRRGVPHAGENLLELVIFRAQHGSGESCNMLGVLYREGELLERDPAAAAHWFAQACRLGYPIGCENVVGEFLFENRADSPEAVANALRHLEESCASNPDGNASFLLGAAYESGRGRPRDPARARALYEQGCTKGSAQACEGLRRLQGR